MKAYGRHLLVEYKGCDCEILNDILKIESMMQAAARASHTTIVTSIFHPFSPQGLSGVVVIEESHLSIHTWPEYGYAAVDFFTCGKGVPEQAHQVLKHALKAETCEVMFVERGMLSCDRSMNVSSHRTDGDKREMIHLPDLMDRGIEAPMTQPGPALRQASK